MKRGSRPHRDGAFSYRSGNSQSQLLCQLLCLFSPAVLPPALDMPLPFYLLRTEARVCKVVKKRSIGESPARCALCHGRALG